ncbi:MAG: catalase [Ruminococcaceae bacterium]|nr:catalase [Oscillospiraceae bacterium]
MAHPIKHFVTITNHRHAVIRHCFKAGIGFQGLRHDLSKYMPSEFINGAKFYDGSRSPNELERLENGYSAAWLHHKGRNKHHFEYWNDYNPIIKKYAPVKMPVNYVIEMFCDRVAASKIYQKDKYTDAHPIDYFERGRDKRVIHEETSALLEKLLKMLRDEGEDKTFEYIRNELRNKKDY